MEFDREKLRHAGGRGLLRGIEMWCRSDCNGQDAEFHKRLLAERKLGNPKAAGRQYPQTLCCRNTLPSIADLQSEGRLLRKLTGSRRHKPVVAFTEMAAR